MLTIHTVSAKMSNYLVPIFDQICILKLIAESSTQKEICGWLPNLVSMATVVRIVVVYHIPCTYLIANNSLVFIIIADS